MKNPDEVCFSLWAKCSHDISRETFQISRNPPRCNKTCRGLTENTRRKSWQIFSCTHNSMYSILKAWENVFSPTQSLWGCTLPILACQSIKTLIIIWPGGLWYQAKQTESRGKAKEKHHKCRLMKFCQNLIFNFKMEHVRPGSSPWFRGVNSSLGKFWQLCGKRFPLTISD